MCFYKKKASLPVWSWGESETKVTVDVLKKDQSKQNVTKDALKKFKNLRNVQTSAHFRNSFLQKNCFVFFIFSFGIYYFCTLTVCCY